MVSRRTVQKKKIAETSKLNNITERNTDLFLLNWPISGQSVCLVIEQSYFEHSQWYSVKVKVNGYGWNSMIIFDNRLGNHKTSSLNNYQNIDSLFTDETLAKVLFG